MQPQQQTTPAAASPAPDAGDNKHAAAQDLNRPVQTVRSGAIGASVWENTNRNGDLNIGITFSRSWKSQDGDAGYSNTYYAGNRDDLHKAIDQACDVAEALERAVERRIGKLSGEVSNTEAQ